MIKKFVVKNYLNEILELELTNPEESGFIVKEVTGLGPDKSNVNIKEIASSDGGYFNSSRKPVKNIVMNLLFVGTPLIEDTRHKSYRYFPLEKPLTLTVVTDRNELSITGYVESNEPDIFSDQEGCQISILCPSPYFTSGKKQIVQSSGEKPLFEFPFSNELIPDPYVEEVIEEEIPGIPEKEVEVEVPEKKELIYNLNDNLVSAPSIKATPFNRPLKGNSIRNGLFPLITSDIYQPEGINSDTKYFYLPFNWERNEYGTFSDNEYCVIEFDYLMQLEMGNNDIEQSSITLIRPTYYVNNNPDPIELQLFDRSGNEINNLEEYKVVGFYGNDSKYSTLKLELLMKIPSDIMNSIKSLYFNALFQHQDMIDFSIPLTSNAYRAQVKISNMNFYKVTPAYKYTEIIPAVPAVPAVIERKLRVENCLIDESLPDYQFNKDDKMYNLRYSEGMVFGEFNNYQFDHVVPYNGSKDVGFVMTIEFANSLPIWSDGTYSGGVGYLVIMNPRYPGEHIIIDFHKISQIISSAIRNTETNDIETSSITTYSGSIGEAPLPPEDYYDFETAAKKGDILTIDTRTDKKMIYYQRPYDGENWKYGYKRFNVLSAASQDSTWFSLSQGDNVLTIRHTYHPDSDELLESDKDWVHANYIMVQTENDVIYEGV